MRRTILWLILTAILVIGLVTIAGGSRNICEVFHRYRRPHTIDPNERQWIS